MRACKDIFLVNCPIDRVWEFFTDIKHLEIINPKEIELKITKVTSHKLTQGSEIWVEGKITMMLSKRSKRYSMITSFSVSPSVMITSKIKRSMKVPDRQIAPN